MAEVGVLFDEFSQGGLIDDADVLVKTARFTTWDYNGKQQVPVLALKVDLEDAEGQIHEQYMSCGELKYFVPSQDGSMAVPVGTASKLNSNTNAVAFLLSVFNADTRGTLAAALKSTGNVSLLEGVRMHVARKAQPKRGGIIQQPLAPGQVERPKDRLECEKILAYVGEAAPAPGAKAPAAAPAAGQAAAPVAAAPAAGGAVDSNAQLAIQILAGEAGGSIKTTAVAGKFFSSPSIKEAIPSGPDRNAVLAILVTPAFLSAPGRPWAFDAATGMITLA